MIMNARTIQIAASIICIALFAVGWFLSPDWRFWTRIAAFAMLIIAGFAGALRKSRSS